MSLAQRFWITLGAALVVLVTVLALIGTPSSQPPAPTQTPSVRTTGSAPVDGADGIGDAYLPKAGAGGYDVQHYDIKINAEVSGAIRGRTTITAIATQDLDSFNLDLELSASVARVNGALAKLQQRAGQLTVAADRIEPGLPAITVGSTFTVEVEYAGNAGSVTAGGVPSFYRAKGEFVIAGEPESSTLWYPANDHPRDAATVQAEISVPNGLSGISAGRLLTKGPDPADAKRDLWVWQVDSPTVTYATFLAVGRYTVEQGTAEGGWPYAYVVSDGLDEETRAAAIRWLRSTPDSVGRLEKYLGPYPFSGVGGFVPAVDFYWGGLEIAMMPVYNNSLIGSADLLDHEIGHMWLGDTVTLHEWNDIFNNESLVSYATWLSVPGADPAREFSRGYNQRDERFWRPALSDLGVRNMFRRVYDRGPLVVHALRTRMGDEAFFALLKRWAQQRGPRSLEDFRRMADEATPEDLTGFFTEWLDQTDRPEPTAENGVPR